MCQLRQERLAGRGIDVDELNNREALLRVVRELRQALDRDIAAAGEDRIDRPGTLGEWSFKEVIAHLTGWREVTAARLEAGLSGIEPEFPWPAHLDEEHDIDEINRWFMESSRDKSVDEVLRESAATFDRVERAIIEMDDADLLTPGRFKWITWTDQGLGPAVIGGTHGHYYEEHEPPIRAWLSQQ